MSEETNTKTDVKEGFWCYTHKELHPEGHWCSDVNVVVAPAPIDMKGYATTTDLQWLYPPKHMPPRGVKLHILQRGGVAIHGEWRWDGGYLGWQYLPIRDLEAEAEAIDFMENGEL